VHGLPVKWPSLDLPTGDVTDREDRHREIVACDANETVNTPVGDAFVPASVIGFPALLHR
jgi:hypothetical protein